ncbi:protein NEOXANTHIN-DEFICIENT 1-like isoform X6 [Musa acuminata AAA Group]|uniref:protein NEOXANTHIN-DEFICIENT 1-like isoform X6 n=1 Tax=Musa acuminata AAA Group TaxID=214697 RepID=UPI0031D4E691
MGESGTISNSSSPSGYALGPPWLFRGRALYQLHLVKADIARALIPKELKLVEAFGYTLGGLFLAHYDDSPAGEFNELVVIPGIVWNPPTSCAWASRVLVNSHEACRHGRKEIGLPSQVAIFSKRDTAASEQPLYKCRKSSIHSKPKEQSEIQVLEMEDSSQIFICNISLPFADFHIQLYRMEEYLTCCGRNHHKNILELLLNVNSDEVTIGWVLRLGYHFQALVARLYTILVFLSIPAKLTAG